MNRFSLAKILFVAALAGGVTAVIACGSSHPPLSDTGPGTGGAGACSSPGAIQACHITSTGPGGTISCVAGTQTCTSGYWSACSTAGAVTGAHYGGTFSSPGFNPYSSTGFPAAATGGGLRFLADPTPPKQDAGLCALDPCDPYCWGWDDEASAPPVAVTSAGGTGDLTGLPSGWAADGNQSPCAAASDCNFDYCCNGAGTCVPWSTALPPTGFCASGGDGGACAGVPDYTIEVGCTNASSDVIVNVCNRGGADATAGLLNIALRDDHFNPGNAFFPFIQGKGYCQVNLATIPLLAGTCAGIDLSHPQAGVTCPATLHIERQNSIFINGGSGSGSANNVTSLALPECTGGNNWGAINNQTCGAAPVVDGGGAAATIFTCVDSTATASMNAFQNGFCDTGHQQGQCLFDSCCKSDGTNHCVQWGTVNSGDCQLTAYGCNGKVNFTAGGGCKDAAGDTHLQICNRGGNDATAGTMNVDFASNDSGGNAPRSGTYNSVGGCTFDLATVGGIGSNGCADLNVTQSTLNGQGIDCSTLGATPAAITTFLAAGPRTVLVNGAALTGAVNSVGLTECGGIADNWSINDPAAVCTGCASSALGSGDATLTYTPICPPGFRAKWQYFAYSVTAGGEVEFNASTQINLVDGAVLPPSSAYLISDPPNAGFPLTCVYGQAAPCMTTPANNLGTFMGNDAYGTPLTLTVTPHDTASALKYSISYDCTPYE